MPRRMWGKCNGGSQLVRMETHADVMELSVGVPQKQENRPHMIQIGHSWAQHRDTCTSTYIAAPVTIGKPWTTIDQ